MNVIAESDPLSMGNWILAASAVLGFISAPFGIALMLKKLFEKKKGNEYVTRDELVTLEASIKQCVTKIEFQELKITVSQCATKDELLEVKRAIEKSDTYLHESMHRFSNVLEALPIKVEVLSKAHD